LTHTY